MCGYDAFWLYDQMLEQEYLERMEAETKEFVKELKNKTDVELTQLLREAEENYDSLMREKVKDEMQRRIKYA